MPTLIDTHCHLQFPVFDTDREAVLERMRVQAIWGITVGTCMENSRHGILLAEQNNDIWATVGLHPSHCTSDYQDKNEGEVIESFVDPEILKTLALSSKKVVAIGETGLDFYRLEEGRALKKAKEKQEVSFRHHIDVAFDLRLPLVIHCREALGRLAEILQEYHSDGKKLQGVVHSFTGTWDEAQPLLDLGLFLGLNGIATFPRKKNQDPSTMINETISRMPVSRLVVETDAPYLAPTGYRGKRNEPVFVEAVAEHIAQLRCVPLEEAQKQLTENARRLFHI